MGSANASSSGKGCVSWTPLAASAGPAVCRPTAERPTRRSDTAVLHIKLHSSPAWACACTMPPPPPAAVKISTTARALAIVTACCDLAMCTNNKRVRLARAYPHPAARHPLACGVYAGCRDACRLALVMKQGKQKTRESVPVPASCDACVMPRAAGQLAASAPSTPKSPKPYCPTKLGTHPTPHRTPRQPRG